MSGITANFLRIGKGVILQMNNVGTAAASVNTSLNSSAGVVPARLRPIIAVDEPIWVYDNSAAQSTPGRFLLSTAGTITIYKSFETTGFTASGNLSIGHKTVFYLVS